MRHYVTDVAIIGAGTGGTGAAYYLNRAGVKTLLIEADDGFGEALKGVNGFFAVESRFQRENHNALTKKEIFEYLMEHAHWTNDARQVSDFVNRSSKVYDLLYSLGMRTETTVAYNIGAPFSWHYMDHDCPMFDAIGKAYLEEGGQLLSNANVCSILKENDRIVGLTAVSEPDGEEIQVDAKAVIIATGECGEVMMTFSRVEKKFVPDMAVEAGAVWAPGMTSTSCHVGGPPVPGKTGPAPGYFRQPHMLAVNSDGDRFTNEFIIHAMDEAANAMLAQKGGVAYLIVSDEINEVLLQDGWTSFKYKMPGDNDPGSSLEADMRSAEVTDPGIYFVAESVEELCEKTGLDPAAFRRTLDEYNAMCRSGRDTLFFKDSRYLIPFTSEKFYVAKVVAKSTPGPGVLKVNHKTECLDAQGNAIPGLYAVGGISSTLNGFFYTHVCAGSRATFGVTSGMVASEYIPEYLKTL